MEDYILLLVVIIIIIYIIVKINQFINLRKTIERSKSTIDVFMKKRYDLIPNLVETIKGYTKYESYTLEEITKLRESFNEGNTNSGDTLNKEYVKLIALIESYPEIKAGENFLQLQKSLSKVESEIQASRRMYLIDLTNYNIKIKQFPGIIISSLMKYKEIKYPTYVIDEVKINFDYISTN